MFKVSGRIEFLTGLCRAAASRDIVLILGKIQETLFTVQADVAAIGFGYKTEGLRKKIGQENH